VKVDFTFSANDEVMAQTVHDIVMKDGLVGRVRDMQPDTGSLDRRLWTQLSDVGLIGATIPEDFGGSGLGMVEAALSIRECGAALAPVPLAESLVMTAVLRQHGDGAMASEILGGVAGGDLVPTVVLPSTEGSNPSSNSVIARGSGQSWTLVGAASAVPFADEAHVALIPARIGERSGPWRLFLVRRSDAGVTTYASARNADISIPHGTWNLERVALGPERLMGKLDSAGEATDLALDVCRVATALLAVGGSAAVSNLTMGYVQTRHQFEKPIASFQAVRHHAANMRILLDTAEPASYYAAWCVDRSPAEARNAGLVAYLGAASSYLEIAKIGMQLHGAIGFTWEHAIHLHLRRAARIASMFGSMKAAQREFGRSARKAGMVARSAAS
jgi:alkylation response protein AidB-like acyl-CoA dehydrogenase